MGKDAFTLDCAMLHQQFMVFVVYLVSSPCSLPPPSLLPSTSFAFTAPLLPSLPFLHIHEIPFLFLTFLFSGSRAGTDPALQRFPEALYAVTRRYATFMGPHPFEGAGFHAAASEVCAYLLLASVLHNARSPHTGSRRAPNRAARGQAGMMRTTLRQG